MTCMSSLYIDGIARAGINIKIVPGPNQSIVHGHYIDSYNCMVFKLLHV